MPELTVEQRAERIAKADKAIALAQENIAKLEARTDVWRKKLGDALARRARYVGGVATVVTDPAAVAELERSFTDPFADTAAPADPFADLAAELAPAPVIDITGLGAPVEVIELRVTDDDVTIQRAESQGEPPLSIVGQRLAREAHDARVSADAAAYEASLASADAKRTAEAEAKATAALAPDAAERVKAALNSARAAISKIGELDLAVAALAPTPIDPFA